MLWVAILSPLFGALLNGLILRSVSRRTSHLMGVLAMAVSFLAAVSVAVSFIGSHATEPVLKYALNWIHVGTLNIDFEFIIDQLSVLMLLVVTGIGLLIHIYAGGYMSHEEGMYERTARFFSYLNLFVFMMLILVLGNSLPLMFVGWEGVGLCSYLLIGYWYHEDANAKAGMKAFLVNRIGDIGFLLGIFLTFKTFGTLSFTELKNIVLSGSLTPEMIQSVSWITLFLFIGACGKSAQLPLYIWLPDAMAGPTPVSALIHAATMVTAGIYMMTRLNFFYYLSPNTMMIVALVGVLTAFFAATIAMVQYDIKKVLAYSTVSQLGYMVLAAGVGAYDASVFHLLTHACFKALLFLGSGSVIFAMHHEQDIRKMGGLRKHLPITHFVFLVGVLAIIGFPGLSGFFSKDEILWKSFIGGQHMGFGLFLWIMATITAGMTAFYMCRVLLLTFYGPNRSDEHTRKHLHETSPVMWGPLLVLAALSIGIGYLGIPPLLGSLFGHAESNIFEHYLAPVLSIPESMHEHWAFLHASYSHGLEWALMGASVGLMLIASFTAIIFYGKGFAPITETLARTFAPLFTLLSNKYFVDELYERVFIRPCREMAHFLWAFVDVIVVDGIVNGIGRACAFSGAFFSLRATGSVHRSGMLMVFGFVFLLIYMMA